MVEKKHNLRITTSLKSGVNDPQGNMVKEALHTLGFPEVESVRMGRYVEATIGESNMDSAIAKLNNPKSEDFPTVGSRVLNNYQVQVTSESDPSSE